MNSKHSTLLSMSYQNIFWGVCFNSWSTQQPYNINFKKFTQQMKLLLKKKKRNQFMSIQRELLTLQKFVRGTCQ